MFNNLEVESYITNEILAIARSKGFSDIRFDVQVPWEGFRRNLASTENPTQITYRYLFLAPAIEFYSISNVLFRKATTILTLHERMHHQPPFNSDASVDDDLVQRKTCESYSNPLEFMFIDVLTHQFNRIPCLDNNEIATEVSTHIGKYFWINQEEREKASEELSERRNYKPRNLRKVLMERNIIPESKSLWRLLVGKLSSAKL
jgi:hypothetical protein